MTVLVKALANCFHDGSYRSVGSPPFDYHGDPESLPEYLAVVPQPAPEPAPADDGKGGDDKEPAKAPEPDKEPAKAPEPDKKGASGGRNPK